MTAASQREKTVAVMQRLAAGVEKVLTALTTENQQLGFVLLVVDVNGTNAEGRVNYISNCDRADIVAALKEITARFEGQARVVGQA